MLSIDTNIFVYAASTEDHLCQKTQAFLESCSKDENLVICELVLVEVYMALRNPAIFDRPLSAKQAVSYCSQLRNNPYWQIVDYDPSIRAQLWDWAAKSGLGFRKIIDVRLALTLRFHGVNALATANTKDFKGFGFDTVWNPLV